MSDTIRVLSIDGGGIRGIIPAMVLAELEKRTGRPVSKLFDLVAGTSTGGILALGLTRPGTDGEPAYTAKEMVSLYETEGAAIFHRSKCRRIRALGNLAEEKYACPGIEGVLEKYFGETMLKDALAEVVVPSYDTERRIPFFFKSGNAKTKGGYDFPMKTIARATSAAPTYFEPVMLAASDPWDYYSLIDGGVYANNPAMCGFVEARTSHPEAADFLVVSLGTGELTRRLPYKEIKGWGLARWAQPILQVVFDGVSSTVDYQLRQLLPSKPGGGRRYWRFQVRLDKRTDAMDDARPETVRSLKLLAAEMLRREADTLDELSCLLRE